MIPRLSFKRVSAAAALLALLAPLGLVPTAQAARSWIVPSQTVLSKATRWVSFEAARSNFLFNPNRGAIPVEQIGVTGPDGQPRELINAFNGRLRSGFELELTEPGTYRIEQIPAAPGAPQGRGGPPTPQGIRPAAAQAPAAPTYFGSYLGEDGQRVRWRGTLEELKAQDLASKPEFALSERGRSRLVTFVTLGEPNDTVLKPEGTGVELGFEQTHPNDVYVDEPATFRVLADGKPVANAKVTVVREGDRYRDEEGAIDLYSDSEGWVRIEWPGAGRYHVQAQASSQGTLHGVPSTKSSSYAVILEVL
ncbi:hypothetical protein AXK12_04665 [Cephaloticoccus capnophilus]|uniref:ABC transporter permease n=1 Tax=Cephaloticoccus capnophilus TaxID=1548208 RepID=A0A139SN31_9BACT|nr:DUF4198 domain-containing protein [Cephaloticoccus capnophilus]KXU35978.1 hypothetical protein AXK12_04665 [Cephaloticoccus capnophilus]